MQHPATDLTPQQLQAIDLFTRGQSVRCIADSVGVTRETLWRWRQQPLFGTVLREKRVQYYDHLSEGTAELVRLALASITRELKKADDPDLRNPLDTAFKVLNFVSSTGLSREVPPTLDASS